MFNSLNNDSRRPSYSPQLSADETQNDYFFMMDLPGVEKKDIKINISNGILTISGERKRSKKCDKNNHIGLETTYGTFTRSFDLAAGTIDHKIKAKFNNGVLDIIIPKVKEVKPKIKRIAVS